MEEAKKVLALFETVEKWNAFIELSNMRTEMVNELKHRLLVELKIIADKNLNSSWTFWFDNNHISISPKDSKLIAVRIEWSWWNDPKSPWCRRGACIWIDAQNTNSKKIFDLIKSNKQNLPIQDFEDNIQNHDWFPFIKQIPSSVFNVDDNVTSVEGCLFMAKDNAVMLAKNLWDNVFMPFTTNEIADLMSDFVTQ